MASDTSLYFKLVPVDMGVGRAMRKAAADVGILNAANASSTLSMEKAGAEANKMSAAMQRLGGTGNGNMAKVSRSARAAATDVENTGKKVNKAFADMSLSAKRGSSQVDQAMQKVSRSAALHGEKTAREFFKIDNAVRNTGRRWASMGVLIGGIVVALIGHTVAFVDAVWQALGVLAAVPAVAFGAAVGLGTLLLVFKGLPAAMKQAGGGGASAADQIAQATHRLEQAQRSAAQAQQDVNDAREQATRDLQDMSRELAKANLDERSGVLAVREAEQNLRQVRARGGTRDEREAAQIAYEQAKISLDEIREKNADLQKQEADRAAKGVEGSDEVQQALQRQQDALYELAQAQKAVADAKNGGGGASAQAYAKLSVAGKQLVDTLRSLSPAWRSVQQSVQQAGLANVAGDVSAVSGVLISQQGHLVGIGAAWNTAIRGVLGYFKSAQGAADLNKALGNTVTFSQHLGAAWEPFVRGFMQFVAAGSDYLPRFGAWIEKLVNDFAIWATKARETGKINDWIEKGAKAAADLGHWIRDISGGIGQIFKAGSGGPAYMQKLADAAKQWRDAMGTPDRQAQLATFFASARDLGSSLWIVLKNLVSAITNMPDVIKEATGALNIIGWALKLAADHAGALAIVMPVLIGYFAAKQIFQFIDGVERAVKAIKAWTVAQWLLNAAEAGMLWPVLAIVAAVALLAAGFVLLWKKFPAFRNFWMGLWAGIQRAAHVVIQWFKATAMPWLAKAFQEVAKVALWFWNDILHPIFNLMGAVFRLQWAIIKPIFQLIWAWVKVLAAIFLWWWRTSVEPVLALLGKAFGWLWDNFLKPLFEVIKQQAQWLGDHFKSIVDGITGFVNSLSGKWDSLVQTVKGLPARIGAAATGMWDGITNGLKSALNWMIDQWNKLDLGIHIHLPSWAGGYGFDINDIFPDIPRLAKGGTATSSGLALVGENGPEVLSLSRGATVTPLPKGGGGGTTTLVVQSSGSKVDDFIVELIRRYVRVQGGGNVQLALGRASR